MAHGDLFGYDYLQSLRKPGAVANEGFTAFVFLDSRRPQKPPGVQIRVGPYPTRAEARNAAVKACARVKGKGFWIQHPPRAYRKRG